MMVDSPESAALPRVRRWLRRLAWTVGTIAALGVIAAVAVPPLAKLAIEQAGSKVLGRSIGVQRIVVNPYTLSARLEGLSIRESDGSGEFLAVEEVLATASLASLLRLAPVLERLRITAPQLRVVRGADRRYSFQDILGRLAARPSDPAAGTARFSVENLEIVRGSVDFDDRPESARHEVRELSLSVPFVSSFPRFAATPVEPKLSARVNGALIELGGQSQPFSEALDTRLRVAIDALGLKRYFDYLPMETDFELADGSLAGHVELEFRRASGGGVEALTLSGSLALDGVDLRQRGGAPLVRAARIAADFGPVDLVARSAALARVAIEGPELVAIRSKEGRLNLAALNVRPADGRPATPETAGTAPASPFQIDVQELSVTGGKLRWRDDSLAQPYQFETDNLALNVSGLSTREGVRARAELALTARSRESLKLAGSIGLAPLSADLRVDAAGLQLLNYAPYLARVLRPRLEGMAELRAQLSYGPTEGQAAPGPRLTVEQLALRDARLASDKSELASLAALTLRGARVDPLARTVSVGELVTSGLALRARREADGWLDLAQILVPPPESAQPDGTGGDTEGRAQAPVAPWSVELDRFVLKDGAVEWEDQAAPRAVKLRAAPIALEASGLSTRPGTRGKLDVRVGLSGGSVSARGEMGITPLDARLDVDLSAIGMLPLQPYFEPFLNVTLRSGTVSARGRLGVAAGADAPAFSYAGTANLSDLALVERGSSEDLLCWKSLHLGRVAFGSAPFDLDVGEIALSDFFARIAVSPEGRINLQDVLASRPGGAAPGPASDTPAAKPPASAPTTPDASGRPAAVRIGTVTLQGGRVNFNDQFIRPNYSARLTDLAGRVSGLSADPASRAQVELRGRLDQSAPIEIEGQVNPLAGNLFLDLRARVRGVELSPLTPYATKYVGYGIEKGKLSLDLKYRVENRKLEASNNLFLDQLTFGERVESPGATKLPVLLAVALLKNSRGEIDIDLPISGSLDDPQFSVGGIIVKVLLNLIVKAVTSPFALLGAIFGGGEELSFVEFAPGRAMISDSQAAKLRSLARALSDRPGLRLEIAGRVDPDADRIGLKQALLDRKVRAAKVEATVREGNRAAAINEVRVEPGEYEQWLRRAFERETFPKPRNAAGQPQALPVKDMENLMLTHIEIGEQEIDNLAQRRAQAVKLWLEQSGGVAAERIFLVAAKASAGGGSGEGTPARAAAARADLSLK